MSETTTIETCWVCGAEPDTGETLLDSCSPGTSICRNCKPSQEPLKLPKGPNHIKFDRLYKKFLRGDLWQDVACSFIADDGCKAMQPLKDRKFFLA